ncbi:unnamed protein product [marine sediment metagenome]|uniref:Uncharacterized protein n=1 Tax=marine sediment metagenome TaxID=412755 RepID=X0VGG1_9ZZZZ
MSLAKTFLAIGIAVIFALFIGYALDVIYEKPSSNNYGNYDSYKEARDKYNLNLFIILIIIGAVAITVGLFLYSFEGIGSGIFGGGVLTVIYGSIISWGVLNKYLKITLLFVVLVLLIFLGYKKLEKKINR